MNHDDERRAETRSYAIGFVTALLLTVAAFAAVRWQSLAALSTIATLALVYGLAFVQLVAQFRFFLRVSFASARDDLMLLLFSALIIGLMVSGTLVLWLNLRMRMM